MPEDKKDAALNALASAGNYWIVNWKMVRYFGGIDEAILIGYLCSMQKLYGNEQGIFYRTIPCVAADTTFEVRRQRKAINSLVKEGILETCNMGLPKKRYFRVNYAVLEDFLRYLNENW